MRKKSAFIKISSVWCFLKSTRPVYYKLNLNFDIKLQSKPFFFKKHIFAFFTKTPLIERQLFWKTAKLLLIKLHIYRQKLFNVISAWSEIMSLKGDQLGILLSVYLGNSRDVNKRSQSLALWTWYQRNSPSILYISASLGMSTSVFKALPGKLDIKTLA